MAYVTELFCITQNKLKTKTNNLPIITINIHSWPTFIYEYVFTTIYEFVFNEEKEIRKELKRVGKGQTDRGTDEPAIGGGA